VLGEPEEVLRIEIDLRLAHDLRELRIAARIRPVTRGKICRDVREGIGRDERHFAPVADDLEVAAELQTVSAALPGQVIEKLLDALVKEQRPVRSRRRAELRYAGDRNRRPFARKIIEHARLVAARILEPEFIDQLRAENRNQLRIARLDVVFEVNRTLQRVQPAADVVRRVVGKDRVASEELMFRADLPIRPDDEKVGELRSGDESRRRLETERGGVRGRHCYDAILLKLAVHALVADVEVRLILRKRPADRCDDIIQPRIGLAYVRSQEKGSRDERRAPEEVTSIAMKLIRAGRRDRVVDDA